MKISAIVVVVVFLQIITLEVVLIRAEASDFGKTIGPVTIDGHFQNWFHYDEGMRCIQRKQWNQAANEFNYYLQDNPPKGDMVGVANFGLGLMYQGKGELDMAIAKYRIAVKNDVHSLVNVSEQAYLNIGTIYQKKKDYPKAIENYKEAIQKNSKSGLTHYFLGMAYLKNGDLENAEKEAQESKKLGITYTALDDGIAKAKKTAAAK
jgi:tetratricopeptide (TPR) repeat protein